MSYDPERRRIWSKELIHFRPIQLLSEQLRIGANRYVITWCDTYIFKIVLRGVQTVFCRKSTRLRCMRLCVFQQNNRREEAKTKVLQCYYAVNPAERENRLYNIRGDPCNVEHSLVQKTLKFLKIFRLDTYFEVSTRHIMSRKKLCFWFLLSL